ncbi:MAG: hypothetical protein H6706_17020 [Myxococcales bacterium]|nr:hypothetical protein [Myxococcales bacterium]
MLPYDGGRVAVGGQIWVVLPPAIQRREIVDRYPLSDLQLGLRAAGDDSEAMLPLTVEISFSGPMRLLVLSAPRDVQAGVTYDVLVRRRSGWGMDGLRLIDVEASRASRRPADNTFAIDMFGGPLKRTLRVFVPTGHLSPRSRAEVELRKTLQAMRAVEAEASIGQVTFEQPRPGRTHPAPDASAYAMVQHAEDQASGEDSVIVAVHTTSHADFVVVLSTAVQTGDLVDWSRVRGIAIFEGAGSAFGAAGLRMTRIGERLCVTGCPGGVSRGPVTDLGGSYLNLVDSHGRVFGFRQWAWFMKE